MPGETLTWVLTLITRVTIAKFTPDSEIARRRRSSETGPSSGMKRYDCTAFTPAAVSDAVRRGDVQLDPADLPPTGGTTWALLAAAALSLIGAGLRLTSRYPLRTSR